MRLIGINGGTFDPIHIGHLRPALELQQALGLDEVRFVPCYRPVHRGTPQVSAEQRCAMIELAIRHQPGFVLDTLEIERGGPSYMVDTLAALKARFPQDALVLMMGTDAFLRFHTWHNWQEVLRLANIAIAHRPGDGLPLSCEAGQVLRTHHVKTLSAACEQIVDVAVTQLDVSSTAIRSALQQGLSVDYLLPPKVVDYIHKQHLYQN